MRAAFLGPNREGDDRLGALVESGVLAQWLHPPQRRLARYARWRGSWNDLEVDLVALCEAAQRPRWAVEVKPSDRPLRDTRHYVGLCELGRRLALVASGTTTRLRCERRASTLGGSGVFQFVPTGPYAYALGWTSARDAYVQEITRSGLLDAGWVVEGAHEKDIARPSADRDTDWIAGLSEKTSRKRPRSRFLPSPHRRPGFKDNGARMATGETRSSLHPRPPAG